MFVEKDLLRKYNAPVLREAAEALLDELQGARRGELLHHERAFEHGTTAFHACRTRTDGRTRLVWRAPSPDRVEIRQAWIDDHDAYEREVTRGDVLRESTRFDWLPLP